MNSENDINSKNNDAEKKSVSRLIEKTKVQKVDNTTNFDKKDEEAEGLERANRTTLECLIDIMKEKNDENTKNEIISEELKKTNDSTVTKSQQNDPSVILGAACALSSNIPELIKDVKKNTTTTSSFDVFIVNEEGTINSYEINHYIEEDLNNQLYSTIKSPSEKKDTYQKKLRNIVNEIKNSKVAEPIKENEPTILEISHYNDIHDNVLVICYCGHGIQSENCTCTNEKDNEDKFSSCSSISEEGGLITKSAFDDSSSEEVLYEATTNEITVSNEKSNTNKQGSQLSNNANDNLEIQVVEVKIPNLETDIIKDIVDEKGSFNIASKEGDNSNNVKEKTILNQTCTPPCHIEHHEDKNFKDGQKDSYGLSKEWDRINICNESQKKDEEILKNANDNSECSMGTQTLAEVLNVNESEIIVNELVEHNTELLKKESVQEKSPSVSSQKQEKSCTEESSEIILTHDNLDAQIKERSRDATEKSSVKMSTLSNFNIMAEVQNIENSNKSDSIKINDNEESFKSKHTEASLNKLYVDSEEQNIKSDATKTHNSISSKSAISGKVNNTDNQDESINKNKTVKSMVEDIQKPSISNLSSSFIDLKKSKNGSEACPVELSDKEEETVHLTKSYKSNFVEVLPPCPIELHDSEHESIEVQKSSSQMELDSCSGDFDSSYKKEVSLAEEKNASDESQKNSSLEPANYVEIEIHLTDNDSNQKNEVSVEPLNNSTITFIENDRSNYSQTLQNIRKNRVGSLVSYFEDLNKKTKENKN